MKNAPEEFTWFGHNGIIGETYNCPLCNAELAAKTRNTKLPKNCPKCGFEIGKPKIQKAN